MPNVNPRDGNKSDEERTVSEFVGLALAAFGAITATLATVDHFGLAGAFFIGAGVLSLVTVILGARPLYTFVLRHYDKVSRSLLGHHSRPFVIIAIILTFIFLGCGVIVIVFDFGEARWWRGSFVNQTYNRVEVKRVEFADVFFKPLESVTLTSQQLRERNKMQKWLHWMALGAKAEFPVAIDPNTKEKTPEYRLVYVSSNPFAGNYTTFHVSLGLSSDVQVHDGVAFLVSGIDEEPWWNGTWRQVDTVPLPSLRGVTVIVSHPNADESLALLLRVTPTNATYGYPTKDQLIPSREFEVHR